MQTPIVVYTLAFQNGSPYGVSVFNPQAVIQDGGGLNVVNVSPMGFTEIRINSGSEQFYPIHIAAPAYDPQRVRRLISMDFREF